nr:uncharacterized protein LOC113803323 [Penaeus vannamei]
MPANPQQPRGAPGTGGRTSCWGRGGEGSAGEAQASPPKSPEKKGGDKGNKKKSKSKKKSSKESGGGRVHVDILGETAMRNALFICHSVQELLFWRGYQWAPGGKKQKGKKGKK